MKLVTPVHFDEALQRIGSQPDRRAHADALIDRICSCQTYQPAPIDLRIATLLRLIDLNLELVHNNPHRPHLRNLIQDRFEQRTPTLLSQYKIKSQLQGFQWYRRIEPLAADSINTLNKAVAVYDGITTIPALRQRLLKALSSYSCDVLILPFLEGIGDTKQILNTCCSRIIHYIDADVSEASQAYEHAVDTLSLTLRQFRHSPVSLAVPIVDLLNQILADLTNHSKANPHLRPANLTMTTDLRRHPLHVPHLTLTIPIELINDGEGTAANIELECLDALGLRPLGPSIRLQSMAPGRMIIELSAETYPEALEATDGTFCDFTIDWINGDATQGHYREQHWLRAQDPTIEWDRLARSNPYSLDAVRKPEDLLGRHQILNRILSIANTDTVGSLYIHGEKRVGKTSLAHVALNILEEQFGFFTHFVDIGSIHDRDPGVLIDKLTRHIVRRFDQHYRDWTKNPTTLDRDGTLTPLIEYLTGLVETGLEKRIVIVLDEFDRLPHKILQRSTAGDNFFLGLRSLSTIDGVGIVLIGAERMKLVTNALGVELNRFRGFAVDYIDRATHWAEFKELVQAPTKNKLEFTEKAFDKIYLFTEGNPYYTKYLCSKLLERAAQRRDAFVDERDVDTGVEHLLSDMDAIGFSHYWEDFILGDETARNLAAVNRRIALLAFGQAAELDGSAERDNIIRCAADLGQSFEDTNNTIDEFIMRRILRPVDSVTRIKPRVKLFSRWIKECGQDQILLGVDEFDSVRTSIELRRASSVSREEAKHLVARWSLYAGEYISADRLLDYLRQFGDEYRQRLIFSLLKAVKFIGVAEVNVLVRDAYKILANDMNDRYGYGNWNTSQLAVSYLGSSGKSSNAMGRAFTRQNPLTITHHFTSPLKLNERAKGGVTDVVVVDDFVGSGRTMIEDIPRLIERLGSDQRLHIYVLGGLESGTSRVKNRVLNTWGSESVRFSVLSEVSEHPWPFEEKVKNPKVFASLEVAQEAESLVKEFGRKLEPKTPLGYDNGCALVVFSDTVPNNAPPILRKSQSGRHSFRALFPRPL